MTNRQTDRQTDRHTTRPRYTGNINPHLCTARMRCGRIIYTSSLPTHAFRLAAVTGSMAAAACRLQVIGGSGSVLLVQCYCQLQGCRSRYPRFIALSRHLHDHCLETDTHARRTARYYAALVKARLVFYQRSAYV